MSKIDKLIEVKDLRVSVEDTEILRGINLSIGEGEAVSYTHLTLPTNREV